MSLNIKNEETHKLAQQLATRRLARSVVPELDACFAALELAPSAATANPAQ